MEWLGDDGECNKVCDESSLPYKVSVSDFYYIGGYYGASDEESMMKELRARGPIVGNFEPQMDFSYYIRGVYSKVPMRPDVDGISDMNMRENHMEMEKVDHSVLIVGWGEENGERYWKLMNSWGSDWGENGFFRMKRGCDESSVESMGEAAIPYIVHK
jgi:cathepsin C